MASVVQPPLIVVYDFDCTIFSCDADSVSIDMLAELDPTAVPLSDYPVWTDYIRTVLAELRARGVTIDHVLSKLTAHPLNPGMPELIRAFAAAGIPQFILSDANTLVISAVLAKQGLKKYFPDQHIFSNRASISPDGAVGIEYHHQNVWTPDAPKNMCKGIALRSIWAHVAAGTLPVPFPRPDPNSTEAERAAADAFDPRATPGPWSHTSLDIAYSAGAAAFAIPAAAATPTHGAAAPTVAVSRPRTAYFGDGGNDYMACLQLSPLDFACARRSFPLASWIAARKEVVVPRFPPGDAAGKPWPAPGSSSTVTAAVCEWGAGADELHALCSSVLAAATGVDRVWWDGVPPLPTRDALEAAAVAAGGSPGVTVADTAAAAAAGEAEAGGAVALTVSQV